ncbi:hypothetical protein FOBRF1_009457 [Fusarium oxysporum]
MKKRRINLLRPNLEEARRSVTGPNLNRSSRQIGACAPMPQGLDESLEMPDYPQEGRKTPSRFSVDVPQAASVDLRLHQSAVFSPPPRPSSPSCLTGRRPLPKLAQFPCSGTNNEPDLHQVNARRVMGR